MNTICQLVLTFFFLANSFILFGQESNYAKYPSWYTDYDITFYHINLEADDTTQHIRGNVIMHSLVKTDLLETFHFELSPDMTIDSVVYNHTQITFQRTKDLVTVSLPEPVGTGKTMIFTIYYQGTVISNGFFSSLSSKKEHTWNIPVTWTLSEPLGAKQWFPCKQYLPDKIDSAWIFITVPENRKAGSNGVLTHVTTLNNHKIRYEWKTKYPIAYYLISFSIADYQDYSFYAKVNEKDSVLVQNFIYNRPGYLSVFKSQIDQTEPLLKFYSEIYGTYPFIKEKYGHCVAPIGGGMEHQTMTTLYNFEFQLVAHELAHQWFGDMATCSSWQDIWVNEGFASYSEYLALDKLRSHEQAMVWLEDAHRSALQDASGSVFIPVEDAENEMRIFNYQLSYKKGASIIHMLRAELNNDSLFFNILREYLNQFRNSAASASDFQSIVNRKTKKDYSWFFDQWYFGNGYPILDFSWKQQSDTITVQSHQTPSNTGSPVFKVNLKAHLVHSFGDTIVRLNLDSASNTFKIKLKYKVLRIEIDPDNEVLKKVTNIASVADLPSSDDGMLVSPIPIYSELTLRFKYEAQKDRLLKITDLQGQTLIEQKLKKKKEAIIGLGELRQGVYLVYVIEGNKRYIRKIIKVK